MRQLAAFDLLDRECRRLDEDAERVDGRCHEVALALERGDPDLRPLAAVLYGDRDVLTARTASLEQARQGAQETIGSAAPKLSWRKRRAIAQRQRELARLERMVTQGAKAQILVGSDEWSQPGGVMHGGGGGT